MVKIGQRQAVIGASMQLWSKDQCSDEYCIASLEEQEEMLVSNVFPAVLQNRS